MPILLVGKKEDQRRCRDLPRMTQLANQGKRHLSSGFLTPDLSVLPQLLCFAQKLPIGLVSPTFYLCRSMNGDRLTKADLYFQGPRRPSNRLSSFIIIFGFYNIEGLIF